MNHRLLTSAVVGLALGSAMLTSGTTTASPGTTERVSVDSAGNQGNDHSGGPLMSGNGRYVVFSSFASNLAPQGGNMAYPRILLHDRQTGETTHLNVSSVASISEDGRYLAYSSHASDLVPDDTNDADDVFAYDRETDATERISVDSAGGQANGSSHGGTLSPDARFVIFSSDASNLVAEDTNEQTDIFLHDRVTGRTERVSVSSDGSEANDFSANAAVSANGCCVAFMSWASNLVPGDTNLGPHVFLRDRQLGVTTRVDVDSAGRPGTGTSSYPSVSADGRYIAFSSDAPDLVEGDTNTCPAVWQQPGQCPDIFVHDRETGSTTRVSVSGQGDEANDRSDWPAVSADGRYVAFWSEASNLVAGDTNVCPPFESSPGHCPDIFVYDRQTGETTRVSVGITGNQGNGWLESDPPAISADGRYVAFESWSTNLVLGDTNEGTDVFVRDREAPAPALSASEVAALEAAPPPEIDTVDECGEPPKDEGSAPFWRDRDNVVAGALVMMVVVAFFFERWWSWRLSASGEDADPQDEGNG